MFRFIFKTAYYAIFFGIVAITLLLLVSLFPIANNYQIKSVLSGSMEPAIHTGSVVVIKSAPSYGVGDVITFGADNRQNIPVTHRVIEANKVGFRTSFVTKGDANGDPDPRAVMSNNVIGKVQFTVPYLGFVLEFVKQPIGFVTFVIVPAALIVLSELFKIGLELVRATGRKKTQRKLRRRSAVMPSARMPIRPSEVLESNRRRYI